MTKQQKIWFDAGYNDNLGERNLGEHPEAQCQEAWGDFLLKNDFQFLVKMFPFYKKGATRAYQNICDYTEYK